MKNTIIRSLSVAIAIILATMLSISVLAENESIDASDVSSEVSSEAVSDTSSDATSDASSEATSDASSDATSDASSNATSDTSSDATSSTTSTTTNTTTTQTDVSTFPWARVITLVVIVVLIVALVIVSKTQSAFGQKVAKFFKEYWSEIKKISWSSPKDTAKATGVVLVFIVVAAIVIGLLDYGFTHIVKLLADIF